MKMKRRICSVCVLAMLTILLTGCQGKKEEPITLRFSWWGGDTRHEATIKAIERYMELNENVVIEYEYMGFDSYYQKLLTQMSGGTQPEIVSVDYKWIGDLSAQGKPFLNINDISDQIDLSAFDRDFIDNYCGQDGYLIGVPCGINGRGALYNKEFFEKYGLTASNDWDWEELLEAGEKVHGQDENAHLLFLTNDVLVYVTRDLIKQKYGENMINDRYELMCTPEDLVECMEMVRRLVETGTMPPFEESVLYETVFADQIPNWLEGSWGMTVLSASNLPSIVSASPFEIDTMRWVVKEGAKDSSITIAPTMMLAIPTACAHPEEAAAFINWFMNDPEAIQITGDTRGIPANSKAREQLEKDGLISPQVSSMLEQALADGGSPENGPTLNAECAAVISDYSHKVGYGEMEPEEAGQKLYEDLVYTLEKLKKGNAEQ
ncbi:MAG: extracellular solute-binding protein [Lachnospiraceae bacterium]|nr:extracellular solute-binding protein [Lachnospiraceae bacterium]